MKRSSGKQFIVVNAKALTMAMLALALVVGLAFVSCSGGDDVTGGDPDVDADYISLVWSGQWGTWVELTINGVTSIPRPFSSSDFVLTVNGTSATISNVEGEVVGGNYVVYLTFTNPTVAVGTRCTVKVVHSGSVVAPFTREGSVTCRAE